MLPSEELEISISNALYFEYLDVLLRPQNILPGKTVANALGLLRRFLYFSHRQDVHFLWRPSLKDPNDDFVLELTIASQSQYILTFNKLDLLTLNCLGSKPSLRGEFLHLIEAL